MGEFDYKRFPVYRDAIAFVREAAAVVGRLPRQYGPLADQLIRAATSIPLNVAEGAGEHSKKEKARFYRMARRSAAECSAIPDVFIAVGLLHRTGVIELNALLGRIAAQLTGLTRALERPTTALPPRPQP